MLLQYGRHAVADIAKEVEGKTEAEVSKYSKKFWKRYHELNDAERIIKNIERGEQRIQRQQDIMSALAAKLERYRNPWQELRLQYGANKGKAYTGQHQRSITTDWAHTLYQCGNIEINDKSSLQEARTAGKLVGWKAWPKTPHLPWRTDNMYHQNFERDLQLLVPHLSKSKPRDYKYHRALMSRCQGFQCNYAHQFETISIGSYCGREVSQKWS